MKVLRVIYHGLQAQQPCQLGRLAYRDGHAFFEYDPDFLRRDINISPVQLKLTTGLQESPPDPFLGLHGVFNDSLPDGWGLYLMDKVFRQNGVDPAQVTPIDRLAFTGNRAMGALSYEPDEGAQFESARSQPIELDIVAREAVSLYAGDLNEVLEHHALHGTPSGGARPKILVGLYGDEAITGAEDLPPGFSHWLAKFPTGSTPDKKAEGAIEYIYSEMARLAAINMAVSQLVPGDDGNAYFLSKRFDRKPGNKRVHVHTVAGLVHANFRVADFEYGELVKLCGYLTKSHAEKVELFRRMVFNVMSGNRDDHTKNFAFMLTPDGDWKNTPAYDITYNPGRAGEHSMTICGKGKGISFDDLLAVARLGSIDEHLVRGIIDEVATALSQWSQLVKDYEIPSDQVRDIRDHIERQQLALAATSR